MKEIMTRESFALTVLLESIEDGNIEAAQAILSRINDLGLEIAVRPKSDD